MSVNSIHTNSAALTALQGLNKINSSLSQVTKRVNTGYKVNDALDDGAAFAVAQGLRADIKAIDAVTGQLQNAKGLIAVANEAGTKTSDALSRLKGVVSVLADDNLSTDARAQYSSQYNAIAAEVSGYISNATFNGQNLLNTTTAVKVISNQSGGSLTITAFALNTDVASALGSAPTTSAAAATFLTGAFVTAQNKVGTALSSYGTANTQLNNQVSYLKAVSDATEAGLGAIVDADLAKESARLQSLQISQQLATQTLGIANQQPSILLGLFRG
jgi:flagellin